MIDRDTLLNTLEDEIKVLRKKTKYKKIYNLRNYLIHKAINAGIKIEHILPYLIAAAVIYVTDVNIGDRPFHLDNVYDDSYIEMIDKSNNEHSEKVSYDYEYKDNILESSTSWTYNEDGLYERVITTYEINNELNLDDKETIFNMSFDELAKQFSIVDIRTIQKDKLNEEDHLYDEDVIVLTTTKKDENNKRERLETEGENCSHSILYLCACIVLGLGLDKVKKILVKSYVVDRLEVIKNNYEIIDIEDLERLLQIKIENMNRLKNSTNIQSPGYIYTLRKRG